MIWNVRKLLMSDSSQKISKFNLFKVATAISLSTVIPMIGANCLVLGINPVRIYRIQRNHF